jgi:hypothetical protein
MPDASAPDAPPIVESPPPTPLPARDVREDLDEPRLALNRLAQQLASARNRKVLFEYLRLRRLLRST